MIGLLSQKERRPPVCQSCQLQLTELTVNETVFNVTFLVSSKCGFEAVFQKPFDDDSIDAVTAYVLHH